MAENVTIDGVDVRVEIHGDGIPVVYTPGAFYSLEASRLVAAALVPFGYKVLLWDRPNTGGAGLQFRPEHLLRLWADTLDGLLAHYRIPSAYVAGVTNGLLASLHFAVWYPPRVRGLALVAALNTDPKWWEAVMESTFLEPARVIEERGMAAALKLGRWGVFDWDDQFRLAAHKREQLLAMDPGTAAATLRRWAACYTAGGRPWAGGLTDEQLSGVDAPAIVFSGPGEALETFPFHSADDARRLHEALPGSQLVISAEHLGDRWDSMLVELSHADNSFDPLVAALADRIDEFIRHCEQNSRRAGERGEDPVADER